MFGRLLCLPFTVTDTLPMFSHGLALVWLICLMLAHFIYPFPCLGFCPLVFRFKMSKRAGGKRACGTCTGERGGSDSSPDEDARPASAKLPRNRRDNVGGPVWTACLK
ncbi:hypothetical protein SNE40_018100 [Patella caerulea]|uniref:Uncharacterized protein n=1 Tax=Patella caerulea TaxID=87958 RepID=A0AAN8PAZ5_PATCE